MSSMNADILRLAREAKKRAEKATPGPWEIDRDRDDGWEYGGNWYVTGVIAMTDERPYVVRFDDDYGTDQAADADFIAHSRTDIPILADALERLTKERSLLAEAIANAAKRAGIYNGEVPLTGPHLLMLIDDLARLSPKETTS